MTKGLAGSSEFEHFGLVTRVGLKLCGEHVEFGLSRYTDIYIFSQDVWRTGNRFAQLAVEVESEWGELRGTLRDLLNFQAEQKWGVFYHDNLNRASGELHAACEAAWESFESQGFHESPNTRYEVVVLLDSNLPATGLLGQEILVAEFASKQGKAIPKPLRMKL
ncbi:MAG: hypothetical protein ACREHD_14685 [Pirellulales bacterium]